MPDARDQQLRDLILRLPDGPALRAAEAEVKIRAALTGGAEPDSRRARNLAMQFLQGELTKRRRTGLISVQLIEVQLAGTFLGIGAQVPDWVPDRPGGPWPPGGDQLVAVFARNLAQTLEGEQQ